MGPTIVKPRSALAPSWPIRFQRRGRLGQTAFEWFARAGQWCADGDQHGARLWAGQHQLGGSQRLRRSDRCLYPPADPNAEPLTRMMFVVRTTMR